MWRNAGITYIRYSQIAAEVTRNASKNRKVVTSETKLKIQRWQDGKPVKSDATA